MSDCVLDTRKLTARKQHVCDHCRRHIEVGEQYERSRQIWDGQAYTFKAHADCYEAALEYREIADLLCDEGVLLADDMESDDEPWLREKYPAVAERLFGKVGA